jgi:hypothetical protein
VAGNRRGCVEADAAEGLDGVRRSYTERSVELGACPQSGATHNPPPISASATVRRTLDVDIRIGRSSFILRSTASEPARYRIRLHRVLRHPRWDAEKQAACPISPSCIGGRVKIAPSPNAENG